MLNSFNQDFKSFNQEYLICTYLRQGFITYKSMTNGAKLAHHSVLAD